MRLLARTSDLADAIARPLVAVFAAAFSTLLVVSVFSRYVFDISIVEAVEITRIAFLWAVFLAATCVAKQRQNIAITVLVDALPDAARYPLIRLADLLIAAFGCAMAWFGTMMTLRMTATFLPTLQISQAWLYAALPISGALIALHALSNLATPLASAVTKPART